MTMNMNGPKKSAKFGLLLKGEYIGVSAILNFHTKFAKLSVGKHVVTAKQRQGSQDPLLPLCIGVSGHNPISKVELSYEPQPKNTFSFRVNDLDLYSLTKEEVDFDPAKTESFMSASKSMILTPSQPQFLG